MKAVLLAGGLGSRLSEETQLKPKPMVEIGGRPILWHIMKLYHAHGIREFIICCGFRGYVIKEYFANYALHMSDMTFDMQAGSIHFHRQDAEDWRVTLVDTGETTLTGGRLKRVASYLADDEDFCFTYGDGLADLDIAATIAFHRSHGRQATITAVRPPARFGALDLDGDRVNGFVEKPAGEGGFINGGFFVLSQSVLDRIEGDRTSFENEPVVALAEADQLRAYLHRGFWQPMDTLRDKNVLEDLWASGNAPWKCW
ncbi:glucose-1-phosphate cytidylyltransferase [Pseudohoeflea coraliihabitans]|uniref:Glucose-1-phosphate cytidylyltransferase n=1 Tax=Pseudohoeflea coraliihabitans TaxID=2860393 RepID=A0ABS6WQ51_9HYPH|nr:glucose-1-phosphate cytidylyltransferase [Pseudohoeflea sp. DP4N28-3]MBW3097512.1 glucose-1-phosphate cytidylyltransferase [Pseudohoeflea sp. DP4N28-3]